jgi:hypothetical protein
MKKKKILSKIMYTKKQIKIKKFRKKKFTIVFSRGKNNFQMFHLFFIRDKKKFSNEII